MRSPLAPERLLAAYAAGIFPMADEGGRIHWLAPDPRAIIELGAFKSSRSMRSARRRSLFTITIDRAFAEVIEACADRPEGTWISPDIRDAYCELHRLGFAHSVETWKEDQLAGGLYGVAIGGAFFGESMFHRVTDASKVALMVLVERMRERGFTLLDVQFMTEHLRQFGAVEIPRAEYERRLREAVQRPCSFVDGPGAITLDPPSDR
jgi:leucyl/phenylalanyl-tRNA--protein transferase